MSNPAALAIIEALKDRTLSADARGALLAALEAVHVGSAVNSGSRRQGAPKPQRRAESSRLTREAIASMELPKAGERYVYDSVCPQFAVRLRPGSRSYVVVKWDRARRRAMKVTLGKCDALTPEQARAKAQQIVAKVADGVDVRREPVAAMTLEQLVDKWYAVKRQSTRTADELKNQVLHYLGPLAHRRAAEVSREDVGTVHESIATKARKRIHKTRPDGTVAPVETGKIGLPATADKWAATLSAIYTWGMGKGLVAENPAAGIDRAFNAKASKRTQYLHGEALLRFWKALEADADGDARDALLLMLYTGQRRGNVLAMRWEAIDLDAGLWTVHAAETKQEAAQTTPLSAKAREILVRRHGEAASEWVFPAARATADELGQMKLGHMTETRPREAWGRICAAAHIEDLRVHDLRHTAGSWLARLGANEAIRQKALGHQTPAMAARYAHLELDPVADALQRMGEAIHAAATKRPTKAVKIKAAP